ncbi:SixA phosphatase family protein [Asaia astilbis]|uniref:SixA phosphatase family protein n=1 Tax=Asaia astilbis TaxID=610244 RepID=UPI00068623DF|nr:histidine phosphatase family protein [Asaia astilbis]
MTSHHLILVRHAQASPELFGGVDRERALTPQGEIDAQTIGAKLASVGIDFSGAHLWHSTARRTTQTALAVTEHLPPPVWYLAWTPSMTSIFTAFSNF